MHQALMYPPADLPQLSSTQDQVQRCVLCGSVEQPTAAQKGRRTLVANTGRATFLLCIGLGTRLPSCSVLHWERAFCGATTGIPSPLYHGVVDQHCRLLRLSLNLESIVRRGSNADWVC